MADYQRNFMDALTGGYSFGQQIKQQRDQTQLKGLAALAYGMPRDQRQGHLSELAKLSPEFAQAQQKNWNAEDDRDQQELIGYARFIKNAPPEQQQAAYTNYVLPKLRARGMQAPDWTQDTQDTILKTVNALTQYDGEGGGGEQFTLGPGSKRFGPNGEVIAEVPFAPPRPQIYTDADGNVHWLTPPTFNGNGAPAPGQPKVTAPSGSTLFKGPDGMPISIGDDLDPQTRDSILQNPNEWSAVPDGGSATLPSVDRAPAEYYGAPSAGAGGSTIIPGVRGPRKQDNRDQFVQLTPDEVQRAGLPRGTVAQRNLSTGAIDVVNKPDARPGTGGVVPLSAGEAAAVRKQFKETKDAYSMFKAFDTALAEIPNDPRLLLDGAAKGRLGTAYNNARASLRILYNTGVLQPGELPMLENALRDPTSFSAVTDPRTRAQIDAQLDELYRVIERNIDTQVESYPQLFNGDVYRQRKAEGLQKPARYKVGQIITEGGRRYRVTGGDLNGNPEVEEVR